jgi:hypothetical protein
MRQTHAHMVKMYFFLLGFCELFCVTITHSLGAWSSRSRVKCSFVWLFITYFNKEWMLWEFINFYVSAGVYLYATSTSFQSDTFINRARMLPCIRSFHFLFVLYHICTFYHHFLLIPRLVFQQNSLDPSEY